MPAERLSMRKIKEVLRLSLEKRLFPTAAPSSAFAELGKVKSESD